MGISLNLISTIQETFRLHALQNSILMLGRQDVDNYKNAEEFFGELGFSKIESLDVSDFEGAEIVFDMNESETPLNLLKRWDVLFDGGTLEHVFNFPNALAHCGRMLKDDGFLVRLGPMNNYVDHGFYQFSTTLWFDWCATNGWDILESILVRLPPRDSIKSDWDFSVLRTGMLGAIGALDSAPYMHFFIARKKPGATCHRTPTQSLYAAMFGKGNDHNFSIREFEPYTVHNGSPIR